MSAFPNLFASLHKWAQRQDENFTTESFVYLLKYLQAHDENAFINVVSNLTGGFINSEEKSNGIIVTTQVRHQNTIQDIQIQTSGKLVFIEVKIGSTLKKVQSAAYLDLLKHGNYQNNKTRLVCLTRAPISSEITEGALPIRWYQVAEWLEHELYLTENENCRFLILNFIDFLSIQRATLSKVSSSISEGLSKYRLENGSNSVLYKRYKNLDKLIGIEELKPLHDFLLLLFEASKSFEEEANIKFDSSNDSDGNGFATYNFNNGEYFVWISYNKPEILSLSTYSRVAEKEEGNLRFGKLIYEQAYKRIRWRNDVLLNKDFFDLDKESQLQFLSKTIKENFEFAKLITHPYYKKS